MNDSILQLNGEQAEKLAELGDRLHHIRQRQNMSLEQVADQTMIPVRILVAIESGNISQLPEPVYVQGFIRRFADAIGIDGAEFANAFPTSVRVEAMSQTTWRGTVQAQLRPLHLYLLYMVLVMGAISGLSYLLSRSTPQMVGLQETAQNPTQPRLPVNSVMPNAPASQTPMGPFLPAATPTAQPTISADISQKPVRIGLTLTAQSWLRIVIDGKVDFEGVLPEGTQRTWTAEKQLTVRAGNAGGVMVSLNDGTAKRLGDPGAVEEVTFDAKTQASLPLNSSNSPILADLSSF